MPLPAGYYPLRSRTANPDQVPKSGVDLSEKTTELDLTAAELGLAGQYVVVHNTSKQAVRVEIGLLD